MTDTTLRRAISAAALAILLAALPAIYARAHTEGSASAAADPMMSGCGDMMAHGMMGSGMMGGGTPDRGRSDGGTTGGGMMWSGGMMSGGMMSGMMGGGERPNQQWQR